MTLLLLPVRLDQDDARGATALGLISFLGLAAAVLIQPLAGLLSDRLRGRVDRRAFIAIAAIPALGGVWLLAGPGTLPVLVLGYVLLQASASAIQAAQQAFIPEHVEAGARGRAAGFKTTFDLGGALFAFLVLGALLGAGQTVVSAILVGGVLLVAVATVWWLVPRQPADPGLRSGTASIPGGFGRLVLASFLFLVGIFGIGRFLLLLVAERTAAAPSAAVAEAGAVLATFTLVTAVAAVPSGMLADRLPRRRIMAIGAVLATVGIWGFVPAAGLLGILAGGILMSLGTAAFVTANWAATTDLVSPADAGRLMGLANLATGGAAACAGLLGPLIDVGGFAPAIGLAAAATTASLIPLARRPVGGSALAHAKESA